MQENNEFERSESGDAPQQNGQQGVPFIRVRLPRGKEVLGVLESRLGASRMMIRCLDGKRRVCRIPGRYKRMLWLREGDVVLIEPWDFGGEGKGDVIYKYSLSAVEWLKKKGYLKTTEEEF
jgi:translation initiation factor 1A